MIDPRGEERERIAAGRRRHVDAIEGAAEGARELRHRLGEHDLAEPRLAEVVVRHPTHAENGGLGLARLAPRRELDPRALGVGFGLASRAGELGLEPLGGELVLVTSRLLRAATLGRDARLLLRHELAACLLRRATSLGVEASALLDHPILGDQRLERELLPIRRLEPLEDLARKDADVLDLDRVEHDAPPRAALIAGRARALVLVPKRRRLPREDRRDLPHQRGSDLVLAVTDALVEREAGHDPTGGADEHLAEDLGERAPIALHHPEREERLGDAVDREPAHLDTDLLDRDLIGREPELGDRRRHDRDTVGRPLEAREPLPGSHHLSAAHLDEKLVRLSGHLTPARDGRHASLGCTRGAA